MYHLAANPLHVPPGWTSPFFGWRLGLDWSGTIADVNAKIVSDQFSLFSVIMMLMLFKGVMASAAGPAPNYDMQKILATRNPREAALMSGFVSVVLMPVRYLMVAGFAVLAAGLLHLMAGSRELPPWQGNAALPEGARVLDMTATSDRVVLRVAVPGSGERLYFLNPATGAVAGILEIGAGD